MTCNFCVSRWYNSNVYNRRCSVKLISVVLVLFCLVLRWLVYSSWCERFDYVHFTYMRHKWEKLEEKNIFLIFKFKSLRWQEHNGRKGKPKYSSA